MELREPYKSLKEFNDARDKITRIVTIGLLLIGLPILIYKQFDMFRLHTVKTKIFCDGHFEKRLGVTDKSQTSLLRLFYEDSSAFAALPNEIKTKFQESTLELDSCHTAYLYPDKFENCRKIKVLTSFWEVNNPIYVLEKHINENY